MRSWPAILLFLLVKVASAQTCMHSGLSKKFDFKVTRAMVNPADTPYMFAEWNIIVEVYLKGNHRLFQKLQFSTNELSPNDFTDCSQERSLSTGKNENAEVGDNDYGDIAVADFNFDGKEDFAIKNTVVGNIGAGYRFYIQTSQGFTEDKFLTDKATFFPFLLNVKRRLFITIVSPTPGTTIRKYKYNPATKRWRQVSTRFVWHDKNLEWYLGRLGD